MCEHMHITCICCKEKILKKYRDIICKERQCSTIKILDYLSGLCYKCKKKCDEIFCSKQQDLITTYIIEKNAIEKILHFFGISYYFRYKNSHFEGVSNYHKHTNFFYRKNMNAK